VDYRRIGQPAGVQARHAREGQPRLRVIHAKKPTGSLPAGFRESAAFAPFCANAAWISAE